LIVTVPGAMIARVSGAGRPLSRGSGEVGIIVAVVPPASRPSARFDVLPTSWRIVIVTADRIIVTDGVGSRFASSWRMVQ